MDKIKNNIYYVAFSLLVIISMLSKSELIKLPNIIFQISYSVIAILFIIKIIFDRPSLKRSLIYSVLLIIMVYLYYVTRNKFFVIDLLAFISIKKVDIKKIIKIDIIIKLIFLLSHGIFYLYDYMFNYDKLTDLIHISGKGTSFYLYFSNPNFVAYYVFAIIFDLLYLSENKSLKTIIICTIAMIITFLITKSRTALLMYVILLVIYFIENKKVINTLYYGSYLFFTGISLYFLKFSFHSQLYYKLNDYLSGRFGYPRLAYEEIGISLIPNANSMEIYNKYIVDNFYDKCFLFLGVITLLLFFIPIIITPKNKFFKEKKFVAICIMYLFFEAILINIGFSIFLLLIANVIFNKEGNEK